MKTRTQKAKLNMLFSLLQQLVSFICGIILPRLMIRAFGSEANGAVGSISTFLSYIVLLEGGIGAVTRSALYKAFATKSDDQVSAVINETKRLYRKIAIAFVLYVLVIACFFKQISHNTVFDYWYSFGLVIVIALSTFAEYFIGISYSLLLQADQANYITAIFRIISTIFNTVEIVLLIAVDCDILTVKLLSSTLFVLRPVLLAAYVKKHYHLTKATSKETLLTQKGSALGQHIAWTLHNNTDVTVLTIFKGLTFVSVYNVYNMVVSQLQNIINSFTTGMEAVFGSMLANNEIEKLQKTFGYYETLLSVLSVTLFSTAAVLMTPFVKLYTADVTDAVYLYPAFGIMLLVAALLYCLRSPYHHMVMAAGHFKQTRVAAYGEAIINITSSIALVMRFGLVGVAIGTILATVYRFIFYVRYLASNIISRKIHLWIKRMGVNIVTSVAIYLGGKLASSCISLNDYFMWGLAGVMTTIIASIICIGVNMLFYSEDMKAIIQIGFGKIKGNKQNIN